MTRYADNLDANELAIACSEALHVGDQCAHSHGIEILESTPGCARLSMQVREGMVNGHNICHGGMIFTLADTAFAHACNNRNFNTVASGCNIDFVGPARLGDTLFADAIERSQAGRTGVYDIAVTNQDGKTVALFRGKSYRIHGHLVPPNAEHEHGE
jgi:acyl-CoA thioesterase